MESHIKAFLLTSANGGRNATCQQPNGRDTLSNHQRLSIRRNSIECRGCGTEIRSDHRHDFKGHSCEAISGRAIYVDGGKEYLRRVGSPHDYIDTSDVIEGKEG